MATEATQKKLDAGNALVQKPWKMKKFINPQSRWNPPEDA
jgi:hypothetical protein